MNKLINANSVYGRPIRIGYEGENIVTSVTFNLQMWIEEFGSGAAVLLVQRNGDKDAYPVPLTIEDGSATWGITSTDCAKQGHGAIQIVFTAGEKVKKSPIFTIVCSASIDGTDTVPDPSVIPEWEQPGSTNPYMRGDKVTHKGKTWESTIDNNVWEPGVYGWSEIDG